MLSVGTLVFATQPQLRKLGLVGNSNNSLQRQKWHSLSDVLFSF